MINERDAALKLFEENRKLAHFTLNRYFRNFAYDDDYQQIASMALWQACLHYDPEVGKFSTYAIQSIRRAVGNAIRDALRKCRYADEPPESLDDEECYDRYEKVPCQEKKLVWTNRADLNDILTERQLKILKLTSEQLTTRQIEKQVGVSRTIVALEQRRIKQIIEDNIMEVW